MANVRVRPTATGAPRYVVQFRHKGKQSSITLLRKRDAEKARDLINALGPDEALARLHGAAGKAGGMPTVAEWIERHIADLTGVTDRTRADYRSLAARHITPLLGPLDVDEVTPADIARWHNALEKVGSHEFVAAATEPKRCRTCRGTRISRQHTADYRMSAKTIANLRALLSSAFGYAVQEKLRGDNPMRRLRTSRAGEHERTDMVVLTPQEFSHLRSLIRERWRPFLTFLVGTGLRFGEAIALEVADVDLLADTPVVRVTKSWKRIPGGFEVGPPKSRKSRRTVSLSRDVVDALAPLVTRPGTDILFVGRDGRRVSHSHFYRKSWARAVAQFEADTGKRPRIHDLRHTHVSWLIQAGLPLPVVQDRLGHESITTTVGVYSHLMPDQHTRTAAALDGLFSSSGTGLPPLLG